MLLERFGHATTVLLSLHLDLPAVPAWADGQDGAGRALVLVGAHTLRQFPDGAEAVGEVLAALHDGAVPEGCHAVAYAPKASEAFATIVAGEGIAEVLLDGPRGSGKTQVVPGALAWLAELHARAGLPLPLLVLWLHDTLMGAAMKTAPSLEEPLHGGLWTLREGRTVAAFTLGGVEMVKADFVPTEDAQAAERLRAAAHVVAAEELIASLSEGGIAESRYDLARSSQLRLETPRRVAICTTNPGSLESWPYTRFIAPGRQESARVQIPAEDRLGPAEVERLLDSFRGTTDLQRRLGLGEWCGLLLGAQVTPNFNPTTHVAPRALDVDRYGEVWMAWDSGPGAHCHATIIGQRVGGEVRIFAGLVSEETGLEQHLAQCVLPWLERRIPWILNRAKGTAERRLLHRYDPNMDTGEGGDIELNGVRRLRRALGGVFREGAVGWGERIGALLDLLNQGNGRGGMAVQIDPGPDTALLRRAFAGEAYYRLTHAGTVARDNQEKPNHPWEDLIDAACYFAGGVAPQVERARRDDVGRPRQKYAESSSAAAWRNRERTSW
jgi:hypothetical protein